MKKEGILVTKTLTHQEIMEILKKEAERQKQVDLNRRKRSQPKKK